MDSPLNSNQHRQVRYRLCVRCLSLGVLGPPESLVYQASVVDIQQSFLCMNTVIVRDLSSFTLNCRRNPSPSPSSPRTVIIASVDLGTHHSITPETPTNDRIEKLITSLLGEVNKTLEKPACWTLTQWDCRSELVRTEESAIGNWLGDGECAIPLVLCSLMKHARSGRS